MNTTAYKRGDYKRVCDICGHPWLRSALKPIGSMQYACPDDFPGVHEKGMRALQAQERPIVVRSIKNAKPLGNVHVNELSEAQVFRLLTSDYSGGVAPYRWVNKTEGDGYVVTAAEGIFDPSRASVAAAGWTGVYLYEVIAEARRPLGWITVARRKLTAVADWLVRQQFGSGTPGDSTLNTYIYFGAFHRNTEISAPHFEETIYLHDVCVGGLALVRAYQITGDGQYLDGAKRAAHCLRRWQQHGQLSSNPTLNSAGGSRYNPGMWLQSFRMMGAGVSSTTHRLRLYDLIGLVFLDALRTVAGDGSYGLSSVGVIDMTDPTDATLSTMISEAAAFWTNGVSSTTSSSVETGFSSATPYEHFQCVGGGSSSSAWEYFSTSGGSHVRGLSFAVALYSWHKLYGYDSKVADVWSWLMTFSSNASFQTPSPASPTQVVAGTSGVYDPKNALAELLMVKTAAGATTKQNGPTELDADRSLYDWGTAGLLAAIQSARDRSAFKRARQLLDTPRDRFAEPSPRLAETEYIGRRGRSGLSYQVSFSELNTEVDAVNRTRTYDAMRAAMVGLMYRQDPRATVER